ncbi:Oxidoreductase, short-chain dehydrogenase/reductase family [hydrothermal vent metagenome]|uniref:Oxidoreductase, short-chain dehydrogenase/reductase family n=1 Tax=hydrothermal vent metagenome TaxID=652676 RepID=A0A1W1EJN2_9ZZZZ
MTIIITGASSGIGRELSRYYAPNNNLYLLARREDKLISLSKELESIGVNSVKIYPIDVSNFDKLQKITQEIAQKESKIDMIIANAGISLGHSHNGYSSFQDFKQVIDINFISIYALLEYLIPSLKNGSKIVLISSLASIITMPTSIAYSSSKRALNGYAEGLRTLLKPNGIKVINILPGFIKSPMTDKNNFNMPFIMSSEEGIKRIVYAITKNKECYKFPKRFFYIIKFLSLLPISLRDRVIVSLKKIKK